MDGLGDEGDITPTLSDGVITLTGFVLEDIPEHLAGEDEEQARRFGWYPKRSTEDTARAAILQWQDAWRTDGYRRAWAAREAGSGALVGGCEVKVRGDGTGEMSWWVFPAYRGRGLATRAIRLACDFAFGRLNVSSMDANIEPDNVSSRRAAEKAGFELRGPGSDGETVTGDLQERLLYVRSRTVP